MDRRIKKAASARAQRHNMENYHNDDMTMFYQFGKSLECRCRNAQGWGLPKQAFILGAYVYLPKIQFDYFTTNFTSLYSK